MATTATDAGPTAVGALALALAADRRARLWRRLARNATAEARLLYAERRECSAAALLCVARAQARAADTGARARAAYLAAYYPQEVT